MGQNIMPVHLDQAVKASLFFEDLNIGSSHEQAWATASCCDVTAEEGVAKLTTNLTEEFGKLTLSLTNAVKVAQQKSPSDSYFNLGRLPKEYSVLRTILGNFKHTQSLDELLPSLLQVEKQ